MMKIEELVEAIAELEAAIADLDDIMAQLETNGRNGKGRR
jgi:prefoldin subunit 5